MYNEQHIGHAKADVGQQRLNEINSNIHVHGYVEHLLPCHVSQGTWDEEEDFAVDDLDDAIDSGLSQALQSSKLYFACLDNMKARTLLNEAAFFMRQISLTGVVNQFMES